MTKRAHINLRTKLASALLALGHIPYEDAKEMTADQIISLYQWHHGIQHGVEVNDEFWNLTPMLILPHRRRTPADTSAVAKVRRVETQHAEFCRTVLAKPAGHKRPTSGRWPKRKMRGFNTSVHSYPSAMKGK